MLATPTKVRFPHQLVVFRQRSMPFRDEFSSHHWLYCCVQMKRNDAHAGRQVRVYSGLIVPIALVRQQHVVGNNKTLGVGTAPAKLPMRTKLFFESVAC
jgi:hypothetical protein